LFWKQYSLNIYRLQAISNIVIDQELPHGGPLQPIGKLPRCHARNGIECNTVIYSPTDKQWLNDVMKNVALRNDLVSFFPTTQVVQ
jgi:hypothetical protein